MPLEELKLYQGTNPKPDDFEKYWEESLEEMHSLDRNVTITPVEFKSPVAVFRGPTISNMLLPDL